jgi:hypothetical protein
MFRIDAEPLSAVPKGDKMPLVSYKCVRCCLLTPSARFPARHGICSAGLSQQSGSSYPW